MFAVFRIGCTDWATPEFSVPTTATTALSAGDLGGGVGADVRGGLVVLGFELERPAGDGVGRRWPA